MPGSYKRSTTSDLVDRQFECPGGHCGPGPECATIFCHLPTCVDAPLCQNVTSKRSAGVSLANRQFGCPPGDECGHGPECTLATCDLPGCAEAEVCQDSAEKKRSVKSDLVDRQIECPPGVECGPGPAIVCSESCDLPVCADTEVCQGNADEKRSADSDIIHPICDICEVDDNGVTVCGCATPGERVERKRTAACPQYCIVTDNGETLCGCAAEAYEKLLQGTERLV